MQIIHIFVIANTDCGKHFQSVGKTLILKEASFLVRFGDLRILFLANDNNLAVSENCQILLCPVEMESTDPFFLI